MWNALNEIAALEGCTIHNLCGAVHDLKEPEASFTAALRVFMMEYYRSAARVNNQVSQVQKKVKAGQGG
jgi:predicted DNA-binding ribbon-helix-helix protein